VDDRRIAAYHESGHAMRCYSLGKTFKRILIPRGETARPRIEIDWKSLSSDDRASILMAGPAAQSIYDANWRGVDFSAHDFKQVFAVVTPLFDDRSGDDRSQAIQFIFAKLREAQVYLNQHRRAVEVLAQALIIKEELDYDSALEIIESASDEPANEAQG
jgi:ATP-dependent Zn protease